MVDFVNLMRKKRHLVTLVRKCDEGELLMGMALTHYVRRMGVPLDDVDTFELSWRGVDLLALAVPKRTLRRLGESVARRDVVGVCLGESDEAMFAQLLSDLLDDRTIVDEQIDENI